jgi:hypothetical protein
VPEFIGPFFAKTTPKRSFSVIINELFKLVCAKTGSINSSTGSLQYRILVAAIQGSLKALLAALHKHYWKPRYAAKGQFYKNLWRELAAEWRFF